MDARAPAADQQARQENAGGANIMSTRRVLVGAIAGVAKRSDDDGAAGPDTHVDAPAVLRKRPSLNNRDAEPSRRAGVQSRWQRYALGKTEAQARPVTDRSQLGALPASDRLGCGQQAHL